MTDTCQPLGPCFDQGQLLTIPGLFQDASRTLVDPTTVTLTIKEPDGTVVVLEYNPGDIVRDATGSYHYDYSIVKAGQYFYRWVGTGLCQTATEVPFYVPLSQIIPATG